MVFWRYIACRWLTIRPAVNRFTFRRKVPQWWAKDSRDLAGVCDYFFMHSNKNGSSKCLLCQLMHAAT